LVIIPVNAVTAAERRNHITSCAQRKTLRVQPDPISVYAFDSKVATGAGLPRVLHIGNSLARGMRQANDFLMALQLTGAGKESSIASLQVRLPAVVIGGGLTGIDTATEVQAYYIKQVEKILRRYEILAEARGEEALTRDLNEEGREPLV
jgi:NADPH-dependent glutamate synthase beta subunit-like oxidoreductase